MIKIGILGLGRIAGHHVKAISKNKKIKIAAACDLNFTKRDSFSKKHKVKCYSHYDLMLKAHPEIDIVAIMSPSGMHYEHALKILNKFRKHLIIEKPTTLRTSNLKKIFITAEKLKRKIYPIFQNRNNKCVMKLKEEINKGKLGKIKIANLTLRWCRPQRYYDLAEWRGTYSHDGGAATQQGVHYLDLLRYLAGDLKNILCKMKTYGAKIEVEDTAIGIFDLVSGGIGTFEITTAARPKDFEATISLIGSKGVAKIGGLASNKMLEFSPEPKLCKKFSEKISDAYGLGHYKVYNDVYLDFTNKKSYPLNKADCIKTIQLLNSLYISSEKNKKVIVNSCNNSVKLGRRNIKISKIYK